MIFEDVFEIRNSPDVERDGLFVLYYANNKGNRPIYLVELTGNSSEMNDGTVVSTASQLWRNRKRTEDIGELLDARRQARIQRESIATATGTFEKSQVIVIDYATDPPSVSADDRFVLVPWIVNPTTEARVLHYVTHLPLVPFALLIDVVSIPFLLILAE